MIAQTTTTRIIREGDLILHIEDTRLFWVFLHGMQMQLTWNELTVTEKRYQQEAAERAAYVAMFNSCELY